ncbi:hypothetical protein GGD63_003232 [Bradyrhizobium sp. cir1]|uniref:hypothetical protein n=1 Tax=Bradyrhizobium sp. cir1 TaxID=1445730 RepID=UPI001829B09A|nr:hypothetical protein [Bradyrhizobium sp. cir1]MBB4370437.1 hypothetical protein [Bradyrhizobium sp. cir1]
MPSLVRNTLLLRLLGIQVTKEADRKIYRAGRGGYDRLHPDDPGSRAQSADAREGIQSFIERRPAVFQGR